MTGRLVPPLELKEADILEELYPKSKPFLRKEGIAAIEAQGTSLLGADEELETPLINGADWAYVPFDKRGNAVGGI